MENCEDNRMEIIWKAKEDLIKSTNIEMAKDEMAVLDNILFRAWQMGWLDKYEPDYASRGKTICQCQNCGKYFVAKRVGTLYCDNPSPEAPEMTCKEYGKRRLWYERQKEDELATLSKKIASAKGMLAKRNPDIPQYAESYEYFKAQRLIWIKEVETGTKTREEYREWLLYMQSQKMIKEACNGIDIKGESL